MAQPNLAAGHLQPRIATVAVAAHHASVVLAQQVLDDLAAPTGGNGKDGDQAADDHPQPRRPPRVGPACLVRVDHPRRRQGSAHRGHRTLKGHRRVPAQRSDAAGSKWCVEQRATRLRHGTLAQVVLPAEHGYRRLEAWPEGATGHHRRQRRAGGRATGGARHQVQSMLRHHCPDEGQLRHLVRHVPVTWHACRDRRSAACAGLGTVLHEVVHSLWREQHPLVRHMAGLAATPAPARRRRWPARRLKRVTRGRPRRVTGVLPQPCLQLVHPRRQRHHLRGERREYCLHRRVEWLPERCRQQRLPVWSLRHVHAEQNARSTPGVVLRSPDYTP